MMVSIVLLLVGALVQFTRGGEVSRDTELLEKARIVKKEILASVVRLDSKELSQAPGGTLVYYEGYLCNSPHYEGQELDPHNPTLYVSGIKLPKGTRAMYYNHKGDKVGVLGCINQGRLEPLVCPAPFDTLYDAPIKLLGVGCCTRRLIGTFDPMEFLDTQLPLPEEELEKVTRGSYFFWRLLGPGLLLLGFLFALPGLRALLSKKTSEGPSL